jgi:general secretion pathway protein C
VFETFLNKGVEPLKWLVIMGIAYTLATAVWSFFESPVTRTIETPANTSTATRAPANVNWILAKNLFGKAGATPDTNDRDDELTVQTRLPLELQSVFVAEDTQANPSAAIVAQRGKAGLLYRVGDKLPGNATLVEVRTDRIILRRAGTRETLMFPKAKVKLATRTFDPEDESTGDLDRSSNDGVTIPDTEHGQTGLIETYREKLATDASATLSELGIEPVDNAGAGGYRIADVGQSPYLRQTGLQAGDVILSVNGRPVGDISSDQLEIDNIMAQGSARIEVQRGSRRFFITASLK